LKECSNKKLTPNSKSSQFDIFETTRGEAALNVQTARLMTEVKTIKECVQSIKRSLMVSLFAVIVFLKQLSEQQIMSDYLPSFAFRRCALDFLSLFAASLVFTFSIVAQTPQPSASQTPSPTRTEEEDSNIAERRTSAMLLITALAEEARTFRNEALRARIQARAADVLWETDTERARTLFRRAWEAAEASDAESERRLNEERQRQMRARPGRAFIVPSSPNARGEVLRLAARRDRALGEELLARFIEAREREVEEMRNRLPASSTNEATQSSPNPTEPPAEVLQRLSLARRLLEDGETERALNFAAPALTNVSVHGVSFLSFLRERDAASADRRFAEMLQRAANDPTTDAATVSVLSSYVLTPFLFVVSARGNIMSSQMRESIAAPALDARLRAQFFRTAAQILLRPIASINDDRTYAGREGTYFTIARLLPSFDQFAPEHSPALRAKLNALTPDAPENFRNGTDASLTRGLVPESEARDELSDTLAAIERTTDPNRRNELYASAAQAAAARGDSRAREFADRITNPDLRSRVRAFTDFVSVQRAARQRNADEVLRVARTSELSPFQRVWAFVEAAEILKRTASNRVPEILEEALRDARRAESSERPRAFTGIITNLFAVDRTRAWELMPELIRAANAAEDFSGEDAQVMARLETGGSVWGMTDDAPNFDLNALFAALSETDMLRATEYARSFTGESPRAVSILAIARAELNRLRQTNGRSED
jgi:hypothetical protein